MITTPDLVAMILALSAAVLVFIFRRLSTRTLPLPPGPKPNFFTGNVRQIPLTSPWLTYASWSKIHGPLVYLRILKTRVLILNTAKSVIDLLDSKSAIYSDRPASWVEGAMGQNRQIIFAMSSQNPRFKVYRKTLHTGLSARAVQDYAPIQIQETRELLQSLLHSPENFIAHVKSANHDNLVWISSSNENDPFVRMIEEATLLFRQTFRGFWLWIDTFPLLRFVPEWFPGADFKRRAREFGIKAAEVDQTPYNWAKDNIATGNYMESFTSKHLEDDTSLPVDEKDDIIKYCSAALYIGGAETTDSVITTFFWLMSVYPEVQEKAQQELEQVIGERLPTPKDYSSMPYMSALIKEVVRWAPAAPLGLRHRVTEDDIYEGYFIPKGTTVVANIWAITHDPELYPNPSVFDPTRHLGKSPQTDPFKFTFGFGRRICPGAHFAQSSMFMTMASILASFNIEKALGPDGIEIEPHLEWTSGVTIRLQPFNCRITPRYKDMSATLGI